MTSGKKSITRLGPFGRRVARAVPAALFLAAGVAGSARADVVTGRNETATAIIVSKEKRAAATAVVNAANVHAAVYDALNAADRRFTRHAVDPSETPAPGTSEEAAAAKVTHWAAGRYFRPVS